MAIPYWRVVWQGGPAFIHKTGRRNDTRALLRRQLGIDGADIGGPDELAFGRADFGAFRIASKSSPDQECGALVLGQAFGAYASS